MAELTTLIEEIATEFDPILSEEGRYHQFYDTIRENPSGYDLSKLDKERKKILEIGIHTIPQRQAIVAYANNLHDFLVLNTAIMR